MSHPHLTGWPSSCPKSPYLRRPPKSRRDLRKTSGCSPKQDKGTLYLDMARDGHLTYNSIRQDCFLVKLSDWSQDVTQSWPQDSPSFALLSPPLQVKGNNFSVSLPSASNPPQTCFPLCKKTFIYSMAIRTVYSKKQYRCINVVLCLSYAWCDLFRI